jgi:hypothetical protein
MKNAMQKEIHSPEQLEHLIQEMGFLPFFYCGIPNFSVGEFTPSEYWFSEENDGVWEWKGPVIVEGGIAYGKFFDNKAGFISMDWFPDFLNYRRNKYAITQQERIILDTVKENKSLLSKEIKRLCGYVKPRTQGAANPLDKILNAETKAIVKKEKSHREGFDTAITKLQMSANLITADFEYLYDKEGKRYGWGVARYCTPEDYFGAEAFEKLDRTPEESRQRINEYLKRMLPDANEEQINKIIG